MENSKENIDKINNYLKSITEQYFEAFPEYRSRAETYIFLNEVSNYFFQYMVTLPNNSGLKREKCDKCKDEVYRVK